MAIAAGAISGTTNPSYCSKLLQREPGYIRPLIQRAAREIDNVDTAADIIYQKVTKRFMDAFLPLYAESAGTQGFVTMQDNPNRDENPELIVEAALRHGNLGPNYMAKVPATESGMKAIEYLIGRGIPVCATECFSLSQAIAVCELHRKTSKVTGRFPPFFLTHITGIFDEEIKSRVVAEGIDVDPELVARAGCIVARRIYKVVKSRGYGITLLGGGARGTKHFTEFVGGDFHITLNWDTMKELINSNQPVIARIDAWDPQEDIEELRKKLNVFAQAYCEDGLKAEEFKGFAPLQRFRNSFIKGWSDLCQAIESSRGPRARGS
jgi:transaldolase